MTIKQMIMNILISLIFVLSSKFGLCMKPAGSCRPFCSGNECITLNHGRVDFKTAEEACRDRNGELLTFGHEADKIMLDVSSQDLYGSFWIGLRLPAGACSNLSAPLRGYEWTSGSGHRSFNPSSSTWKDNDKICSPRCVSLSNNRQWTERLCSDKSDGFLCRAEHKDACRAQELSDPTVFLGSETCKNGPCQQKCTDVKGGYKCSCYDGYISDSKNPKECKLQCTQEKCPAECGPHYDGACSCPDGYLVVDRFCEDMNECQMDGCAQGCTNTFGSFVCSCDEGYVLTDQVKCIKETPIITSIVKPAANNTTEGTSASSGGFLWIWIFVVVAVVVLIIVIRFYVVKRQKRREQNSRQQPAAPADNIEC